MSGWSVLMWACVCSGGAIAFLNLINHELQRVEVAVEHLRRREQRTAESRKSRKREQIEAVAVAASSGRARAAVDSR